jgi:hypothetical protein
MDKFLGFKTDEILTCLLLIVVGYVIAKMFNGCSNNGFSVGIQRRSDGNNCVDGETCNAGGDTQYRYPCPGGGQCYNLVIDDGNVKHCINPEGVYGDSNDTYCIQDELPDPNIPVNCEGHWDDDDNCDINCERKYVVDTPASNGGKRCDDIGKTKKCKNGQGKCPPVECMGKLSEPFDTDLVKHGKFEIATTKTYNTNTDITLNTTLSISGTLCIDKRFIINKGGKIEIKYGGTLNINKDGNLEILKGGNININQHGSITNGGNINNNGHINSFSGNITNKDGGTIDNHFNITNRGRIYNNDGGTITNQTYAVINNYQTITNKNGGRIYNKAGAHINLITRDGKIVNNGEICGNYISNLNNVKISIGPNPVDPNC